MCIFMHTYNALKKIILLRGFDGRSFGVFYIQIMKVIIKQF